MNPAFFAGIDPGFSGAVALLNASGSWARVWDMPIISKDKDRQREIDMAALHAIFSGVAICPQVVVGIEWPSTRPGEGAERCLRFGRQQGILLAFAHCRGLDYRKVPPNLWKGRLGLPGKTQDSANERCAAYVQQHLPQHAGLIYGPRGGILDGRMDALLLAHWLSKQSEGKYAELTRFAKRNKR